MHAGEHAEYSSEAPDVQDAHAHLRHALNCVVGAGNGVIPDTQNQSPALAKTFRAVAAKLRAGPAENDLAKSQADATEAAKTIVATIAYVK
jgi:cytochrome c-type biogenesis protein CcmH/NrfF